MMQEGRRFYSKKKYSPLQPYRSLVSSRFKISGTGLWPLADHLDGILCLPFQEPLVLEHHEVVDWTGPDVHLSLRPRTWNFCVFETFEDSLRCSICSMSPIPVDLLAGSSTPTKIMMLIGRSVTAAGSMVERHPTGPSAERPCGPTMTCFALVGRVSDHKDFKGHSFKGFANVVPFEYSPGDFEGSPALRELSAPLPAPTRREVHGDRFMMKPRGVFPKDLGPLRASFRSLFQGDQLGVEYALAAHSGPLRPRGLLQDGEVVLGNRPFPRSSCWHGLVIDDFFAISCKKEDAPISGHLH